MIYFSLIVLHDIVSDEVLECWRHFVLACRVLYSKDITMEQVCLGDALLVQFCRRTERIFGGNVITPNMHLHCHLRERIVDYGPLHGFWLYAFERYNGILGALPNNHSIDVQIMKRFVTDSVTHSAALPRDYHDELLPFFPSVDTSGSVADTLFTCVPFQMSGCTIDNLQVELRQHCSRKVLHATQKDFLIELYTALHSVSTDCFKLFLPVFISMYKRNAVRFS